MNNKTINLLKEFANQNSLMFENGVIYGNFGGYDVNITLQENAKIFLISLGVKINEQIPNPEDMKAIANKHRGILSGATMARLTANFTVKPAAGKLENTIPRLQQALNTIANELSSGGFVNCCQGCGSSQKGTYMSVAGTVVCVCDSCANTYTAKAAEIKQQEEQKRENLIGGVVGAFLGSLLGAICIILISRLGYVSAISGLVMGVCVLKGYEMLGGKLTNRGAVISCIIMAVMVYVANYIDWGIIIAKEFNIGLFNGIGLVAPALNEGVIAMGDYIFNLILLYLFTALGAIPSIRNKMKARELNTSVYALPSPINDNNGAIID